MNTSTRCKFRCESVEKRRYWDGSGRFLYAAKFEVVMQGSEENQKFFEASPQGRLEIGCFSADIFEPGKEYYLDISLAAAPVVPA